jgi:hypothetical protein
MPANVLAYFLIPYVPIWAAMFIYLVTKIRSSKAPQIKRLGYIAVGFQMSCLWMVISWAAQGGIYESASVCYGFCRFTISCFLPR